MEYVISECDHTKEKECKFEHLILDRQFLHRKPKQISSCEYLFLGS